MYMLSTDVWGQRHIATASGSIGVHKQTKSLHYDTRNILAGDRIVNDETTTEGITISGTFNAPALEQVYRPNRPISHTAHVGSFIPDPEQDEELLERQIRME